MNKKRIEEEFVSTLSHEIRTPLTSIKGFSQTMLSSWDKIDDDKKKEFLGIILEQSQRLIHLVENILNVAKIDSNNSAIILSKVDVNNLVKNAINMIYINHKDFVFDFKKAHSEIFSMADSDKAQQVLINILDNAVKYSSDSKKIDVKTTIQNEYNVISIKNYGSYINKEDKDLIFNKFYRVDSYIKSSTQGSGLGLYIAKNLVEKMQGKIEVVSLETEKSVEFLIYLPIYNVEKITKNIGI